MSAKKIPVEHFDYGYIEKCSDILYLGRILEVLRSGEEGLYPHLIQFCENHLKKLDPKNHALRKDNLVTTSASLPEDEWSQINEDIMVWEEDTKHIEISLKQKLLNDIQDENMPPVRCSQISHPKGKQNFSKLAVLNEENIDATPHINSGHPKIQTKVDVTSLTDQEKVLMANREKEKGNEAFRANDYEEAAAYYSRSLSILPTVAALNNRALAEIKQKHWRSAMKDCQRVLELEPRNIKALLRCAMVHKQQGSFQMAADDLRIVLQEEPLNAVAIKLMTEIKACYPELNKTKGKTILIQNIDDEEEGGSKDAMKAEQNARPVEPRQPVGGEESAASCAEKENMGNAQKRPHHGRGEGSPHGETNNSHGHRRNRGGSSDKYKLAQESPDKVANGTAKMGSTASNHPASQGSGSRGAPAASSGGETVNLDAPCGALPPPLARLKNEGNLLFKNGQFADAVEKYSQAITGLTDSGIDSPEDLSILYSNRAACRLKDGNSQDCIDDCTRALELQPFSLKPLLRRAMAYETLERYSKAYVDYKTVLQIDISVQAASDSVNRITKLLIQQDGPDWREHLPDIPVVPLCAQRHRREEPPSAEVLQARAEKTARDAVSGTSAVTGTPTSTASPSYGSASVGYTCSLERRAEARFSTLKQEGNDLVKKGQYQDALGKYSECLKLKHEECAIYTNRALCYLKLEMFAEAKQDCDTALRLEPTNKKAFYRRAMANKGLKDYLACSYDLQEVLQQDPNVQEAEKELEEVTSLLRHSLANNASTGKPRKVVPITEVDGDEETGPPSTSETNGRAENFSINLQPTNAYEFGQAINAARSTGNTAACARLLSSISPETLPQYLSTQLDGNNISFIMQALDSHLLKRDPNLVYHHLKHLHTADRFSVAWMLLDEEERGHVTEMFEHLSAVESTEFTKNDVQYLANKYI